MTEPIETAYSNRYKRSVSSHCYPVEWVVRAFLGTYPDLKMDRDRYSGRRLLDLGFGDGRNFPLLHNSGFRISGVEIADEILEQARARFIPMGIPVDLKKGTNSKIPYDAAYFDYVLACHAIYYVSPNESFNNNLEEVARVLSPAGILLASLPAPDSYILKGAIDLGKGHVRITADPLGLRNGTIFRVFQSKEDIVRTLSPAFEDFVIGRCNDDFFGLQQNVWIVVCSRRR